MSTYAATSPRLHLQSLSEDLHLHDLHAINSNPQATFWSTRKVATDIETTRAFIRASLPTEEQPWNERWAILLRQTPENPSSEKVDAIDEELMKRNAGKLRMIGIIGVVREQEIGYKIHPDFWGKGYMTEALAMFIEMWWGMEINSKYDRLLAGADSENKASQRVLEKAGFKKGKFKKEFYERATLGGRKGDMQFYYLERPRSSNGEVPLRRKSSKEIRFGVEGVLTEV